MPSPDFIPYTDEELQQMQLGPYASDAVVPAESESTALSNSLPQDFIPYEGKELIDAIDSDMNRQLNFTQFESYRKALSEQPDTTWREGMSLFGEGAQMAAEEFFGGIWSAVSQGMYITDPLKGLKTVASGFARGGVDMFTIVEDIFSKDFYTADTYEKFLEDMELEDDKS